MEKTIQRNVRGKIKRYSIFYVIIFPLDIPAYNYISSLVRQPYFSVLLIPFLSSFYYFGSWGSDCDSLVL